MTEESHASDSCPEVVSSSGHGCEHCSTSSSAEAEDGSDTTEGEEVVALARERFALPEYLLGAAVFFATPIWALLTLPFDSDRDWPILLVWTLLVAVPSFAYLWMVCVIDPARNAGTRTLRRAIIAKITPVYTVAFLVVAVWIVTAVNDNWDARTVLSEPGLLAVFVFLLPIHSVVLLALTVASRNQGIHRRIHKARTALSALLLVTLSLLSTIILQAGFT